MPPRGDPQPDSAPLIPVFILSAAALAYEVLLIRLFSIIHWHHFSFMVISIALLGYGASGSLVTVFRERLLRHFEMAVMGNILLFGIASIVCFLWVQSLPFNTLEILWDRSQWLRLLLTYVLLALPFFFIANIISLSMVKFPCKIALIYASDLFGAGLGALFVMLLLQFFTPQAVLRILAVLGLCGGWFMLHRVGIQQRRFNASVLLLCLITVSLLPQEWLDLKISEFKGLSQTLLVKDTVLHWTHHSPLSRIDVVESDFIPFRHAPGLSLQSPSGPPRQLAIFTDADAMTTIDYIADRESLRYTDYVSAALPYHVHANARKILLLETASGASIQSAEYQGIRNITAVEADKHLSRLIPEQFAAIADWQTLRDKVSFYEMTAREYAASAVDAGKKFDLVILGPSAASSGGAAGVDALMSSYSLTSEALQDYLSLLAPGGLISLTGWASHPPRSSLKLFTTAVAAMQEKGIANPQDNLAWIRSWNTTTLLMKNTALTPAETARVRRFSIARGFDLAWLPDISSDEVNQFQHLQKPLFFLTAQALFDPIASQETGQYNLQQYQYDIQPATDNRPFFNHFFKWSSFSEFMSLPGRSGLSLLEVGYPTLLLTLGQALLAGLTFILLPLLFIRNRRKRSTKSHLGVFNYFALIGLAFLMIELAVIERLTLILGQPLYAVAVSLCAFLVFSGFGSLIIQRQSNRFSQTAIPQVIGHAVFFIATFCLLYVAFLPEIGRAIMTLSEVTRVFCVILLIAPLALVMGMPFPLGLARLQDNAAELIPWAWGINGCASVVSAVLAKLLAMEIGFSGVMLGAVLIYAAAWRSGIKVFATAKR